jgi:pimeloyl-ACP methyl ester carboxylesterase
MRFCRNLVGVSFSALLLLVLVGLSDARAGEQDLSIDHDGLKLRARLVTAEDAILADGVVLITHGTLAHNRMEIIDTIQTALAERGHNSLAITLSFGLDDRGGMYDCEVPHTHKHTDAIDEIGLWLDWLKGQGAENVFLMGHSRGGNQTAWFAAEHPDPIVKGVVLIAPATWNEQEAASSYEDRYGVALSNLLEKAKSMVDTGQGSTMMTDIGFLYCSGAAVSAETFMSYYQPDPRMHTPNLIPEIKAPVLVIVGSEDEVVTGLEEAMAPLVEAGEAQMTVVDGADHFFLDFYAEDAADAVDEFIMSQ